MAWVYIDIKEVLGYLRRELVGISPSSCKLTHGSLGIILYTAENLWRWGRGILLLG